jgi:hypothetical protein
MNRKSLLWLAAGLIVLVVLAVVGQRQSAVPTADTNAVFLPGLTETLNDIERIEIAAAGDSTVATLERTDDGWTVRERGGYRADLTKVRHTLLSFAEANILEAKTANPEFYSMLGVEAVDTDDARSLKVRLAGADVDVEVIVGDAAGDYRRYVRRASEAQSYMINRDPELGESAADWLDTALIDIQSDRVRSVTVVHPDDERVTVSKTAAEQDNFDVADVPEGRELLYPSVANVMASVLQNLSLEDVERADASAAPTIVTEYLTFDGLAITAESVERDDGAWIRLSAAAAAESSADADSALEAMELNQRLGGWQFRIPTYKFEQLTRRMDDLLKAQP